MAKILFLILTASTLTACAEYQGRKTNCWSGGMSFMASDVSVTQGCSDWTEIGY